MLVFICVDSLCIKIVDKPHDHDYNFLNQVLQSLVNLFPVLQRQPNDSFTC